MRLAFCVAVSISSGRLRNCAATRVGLSTLLKILIPVAFVGLSMAESSLQFVLLGALNCAAWHRGALRGYCLEETIADEVLSAGA